MKRTIVSRPIPEKCHRHLVCLEYLETVTRPGSLQDTGTHDTTGPHQAHFWGKQVHAATTPTRTTSLTAKQFCDQFQWRHSLSQGMAMPSMRTENNIFRS